MARLSIAGAATALALACSAAAQTPPQQMPPAPEQAPPMQAAPDQPPSAPTQAQAPILGESTRAAPTSGVSASLGGSGATGPDSVGTLPQRDTDFDRRTWRDTDFNLVLRLLDRLPDRIDSAAEHELTRNLLVAIADAPPGDDGDSKLLARRVEKLMAIGNVADAAALARAAPGLPTDEALAHAEVDSELLAGQLEGACIAIRAFAPAFQAAWAQNGLILCRARAGEKIEGGLPPMDTEQLGPLARIADAPLGADPATATPGRLYAAAHDPMVPPDQRLEAAFAAGRASAIHGESLAAILAAAPPKPDAAGASGAPENGEAAAALYRDIAGQADPAQKAALAERGLLSPDGVLDKVGVALATPLRDLQPSADQSAAAQPMATIFYGLGDAETAGPWADLAGQVAGQPGGVALWPYRVILKDADPVGIADWEQQSGLDPAHAARIVAVLSAFDVTRPPPGRRPIAGDEFPDPPVSELIAMDRAAASGHVGETVLRAIAILGRGGPARAHPLALRRVLYDLDQVHMHDEAHALAFEAITATLLGH